MNWKYIYSTFCCFHAVILIKQPLLCIVVQVIYIKGSSEAHLFNLYYNNCFYGFISVFIYMSSIIYHVVGLKSFAVNYTINIKKLLFCVIQLRKSRCFVVLLYQFTLVQVVICGSLIHYTCQSIYIYTIA